MRLLLAALATSLCALSAAAPAVAAPAGAPVRFWSVSRIDQGDGEVQVAGGAQSGGVVSEIDDLGPVAFNFRGTPLFDRAEGDVFSSADGLRYSVGTTAPILNPFQPHSAKGGVTHLDELQAYEKQASDATLKITISGVVLDAIDANARVDESQCPPTVVECHPIRTIVRFHARAYASSAGGDFFDVGGVAFVKGRHALWDHVVATSSDSQKPVWTSENFIFDPDFDDSDTFSHGRQTLDRSATLKVPLGAVRTHELFGVHVSLEAEAINDRGGESAAQAFIRDPQESGPALLTAHGLAPRGRPRFKEPRVKPLHPARCPHGAPRHAGTIRLSSPTFVASESSGDPLVLVDRVGGSRGSASATVSTQGGTATSGSDFGHTTTTVRFGPGDHSPRLVEVPIREDGRVESPESFSVALSHARCAKLGARHAGVTIVDDDATPAPPPPAPPAPPVATPTPTPTPGPAPSGLDHTLGIDGRVSTPAGDADGEAVVLQPDGGIVTAGRSGTDFALTRHDDAGALNHGFGKDGIATTDFGGDDDEANDAALLGDGGIVAVGRTDVAGFTKLDFALAAYRPDGSPDPEFGAGGKVVDDLLGGGDQANAVAVQPDGKIVVAGFAAHGVLQDSDFAIARYRPDGSRDPGFGDGGLVTTDLGTRSDDARAVAIQPDGRIVVAGTADEDVALARYMPDGKPDAGFGHGGSTITDFGSEDIASGVAIGPGGEILLSGTTLGPKVNRDFALMRYREDGSFETIEKTDVDGGDDFGENLVVDRQGRVVMVGTATSPTITDMAIVRYDAEGHPDPSFDADGVLTADFHGKGDFGRDLAIDGHDRIVAAGATGTGTGVDFALLRALP